MRTKSPFVLFWLIILFLSKLDAQWSRTGGPSGGLVLALQSNDQYLFAGARNGVYRSPDDGKNWERLSNGLPFSMICWDLDLQGDNILFYGYDWIKRWSGAFRYQVFKSTNNGDQWKEIPLPDSIYFPSQVAIHDSIIFLSERSLLRSTNDGETWTPLLTWAQDSFDYCRQIEIYNDRLFVIGANHAWVSDDWGDHWQKIFFPTSCLGYNLYPLDSLLILVCEDEAYRSTDYGKTWKKATGWEGVNSEYKDIYFQNDTFYTNSIDMLFSVDFGQSWKPLPPGTHDFFPAGITIHRGQIYACSPAYGVRRFRPETDTLLIADYGIDATFVQSLTVHDHDLWAGVNDYGLFKYDIASQTWDKKNFFPTQYGIIQTTWINDSLFIANFYGQVFRSGDYGQTWKQIYESELGDRVALEVTNNKLYVIGGFYDGISKSTDFGNSWEPAFPIFEEQFNSIPWSFVQHHGSFFMSTLSNQIYKSSDEGKSWQEVPTGIDFNEKYIKRIWSEGPYLLLEAYDGNNTGDDELKLYVSREDGISWSLFMDGLPFIDSFASDYVQVINFVFYSDTLLMSAYDQGIFFNTLQDQVWKPLMVGDKFPRFSTALALDEKKVFVGIYGMGVWQMNTNGIVNNINEIQPPFNSLLVIPNPASDEITFQVDRDVTEGILYIIDMQGKAVLIKHIQGFESVSISICQLPAGKYILKLETQNELYVGSFVKI